MAHTNQRNLAERIWDGDVHAVNGAWDRYYADPEKELVMMASALYSFRAYPMCASDLLRFAPKLVARTDPRTIWREFGIDNRLASANALDVISTILLWMSKRSELPRSERTEAFEAATRAAQHGEWLTKSGMPQGGHTRALLLLTLAEINFRSKKIRKRLLAEVVRLAPRIADANQRTRVYRKLGYLRLKSFRPFAGLRWLLAARSVRGAAAGVKAKNPI